MSTPSFHCHVTHGATAQEPAVWADKGCSALSESSGTTCRNGPAMWGQHACQVSSLPLEPPAHRHTIPLPGHVHMVPQEMGWFSPAVPKAILAPALPFSKSGDSFLQWLRACALPLTSSESVDKLLSFLVPRFLHLLNGDNEVPVS